MKKSMGERIRNWYKNARKEEVHGVVTYMLKNGMDSDVISECTGLSVYEIRRIGARFTGTTLIYGVRPKMFD